MIDQTDIDRITNDAHDIATEATEVTDEAVLEQYMILGIVAIPTDTGVDEHLVMRCSSPTRHVQEGILTEALRQHDILMRKADD